MRRQDRVNTTAHSRATGGELDGDERKYANSLFSKLRVIHPPNRDSHIFDGVTLTKETAAFQLCDITDGMLRRMIEEDDDLRDVCNVRLLKPELVDLFNLLWRIQERDGWYTTAHFERIKTVLRHKFFSLLEGHVSTDEECAALLVTHSASQRMPTSRTQRLRPGKHNMAKGALRPEDAAVSVLPHSLLLERWANWDRRAGREAESRIGKECEDVEGVALVACPCCHDLITVSRYR
jgi:hypothetical protein